jgi:uncharacterized Zn finger protein
VHYVLGEALDRDPFLLFELRGRERDQVLTALKKARGGTSKSRPPSRDAASRDAANRDPKPPSVALGKLTPQNYAAAPAPLPALSFSFDAPVAHGAILRQLGTPAAWNSDTPAVETLARACGAGPGAPASPSG